MGKTILRLIGLILVLQGILTLGLVWQWQDEVNLKQLLVSKESIAVVMGLFVLFASDTKIGGCYEN